MYFTGGIKISDYTKAVFFVIIAYISIAMMSVFVKLSSDQIPSGEILFFRFFIGLIFITPPAMKNKSINLKSGRGKYFTLRNIAGLLSMLLMFYSLNGLPVSVSVLLMNTSSLLVPLFLLLLYRERTSLPVWACTAAGFAGVYIMLSASSQPVPATYFLAGVSAAVLAALAYIGIKQLSRNISTIEIVFYFHLTSSILLPILLAYNWVLPSWLDLFLLVMVGIFGLIFQVFMTKALAYSDMTAITPFIFTGVIASGFFDWIFWNDIPSVSFWVGFFVIVISVSMLVRLKNKKS